MRERTLRPAVVCVSRRLVSERRATCRQLAAIAGVSERTMQRAVYGPDFADLPGAVESPRDNWWLRGERSPNAKLTEADAREILGLRGLASSAEVAEAYPVSSALVRMIWCGKRWGWLQEETEQEAA